MSGFDLSKRYFLLQALDLTGRTLFGDDWQGSEPWARPCDDPQKTKSEKELLLQRAKAARLRRDTAQSDIEYATDEEARKVGQQEYLAATNELRRVDASLHNFPRTFDGWDFEYSHFKRRLGAELRLCEAITHGGVPILDPAGNTFYLENLASSKGFRISFNLSIARQPRDRRDGPITSMSYDSSVTPENPYYPQIRDAAFVEIKAFEAWLYDQAWALDALRQMDPRTQCQKRFWVLESQTHPGKVRLKKECFIWCQERIGGLSQRVFDSVWKEEAPEAWKEAGTRAGETIHRLLP